jgi:hypothetical protein
MLRLRVTYWKSSELKRDLEQQLARGGLLVKVEAPGALQLRDPVNVEVIAPGGRAVVIDGEVLNVIPGYGVAVTIPPAAVERVKAALAGASPEAPDAPDARHELATDAPATPAAPTTPEAPAEGDGGGELNTAQKAQAALTGSKDERAAILRDKNKSLHVLVLRNPHIRADEVEAIAKNPQMTGEVLRAIGEKKEWLQKASIAVALARNPKTPPEVGVRALEFVSAEALRQMAKGVGAPPHVTQAARKRVLNG